MNALKADAMNQGPNNCDGVVCGFEHVLRTWDPVQRRHSARILPGEFYVTRCDEVIATVLGSCVSACLRDPEVGVGGMNHFMLPGCVNTDSGKWAGEDALTTRYGIAAMESLINELLKLGARKERMELKLFGGGAVVEMEMNNIGDRNIAFVREFAQVEGLRIAASDLGGIHARKVRFFPRNGKVLVRQLKGEEPNLLREEMQYEARMSAPTAKPTTGSIELFD